VPGSEAGHWLLHAVLAPALAWHVVGEPYNKPKRNSGPLTSTSKIGRKILRLLVSNRSAVLIIHAWPSS
jgi:hypothetical protein